VLPGGDLTFLNQIANVLLTLQALEGAGARRRAKVPGATVPFTAVDQPEGEGATRSPEAMLQA
jgi:hypothetical protein